MESLLLIVALAAVVGCLGLMVTAMALLLRLWKQERRHEMVTDKPEIDKPEEQPAQADFTTQEQEALRRRQEAQRKYEDGWVDCMSYDGRPHWKGGDSL